MSTVVSIQVHRFTVGQMAENCYLLLDPLTREMLIIDPGDEASYIADQISKLQGKPTAILATHGHFDHILAASELQMIYHIPFRMSAADKFLLTRMTETAQHFLGHAVIEPPPILTSTLEDGDRVNLGNHHIDVLSTAGHTLGSLSFYLKNDSSVLVGDTLFAGGGVGRTDFAYSDKEKLYTSVKRILSLPEKTVIHAGHGESSAVFKEKLFHV